MPDFPELGFGAMPFAQSISALGGLGIGPDILPNQSLSPTSVTWRAAHHAYYWPVIVEKPLTVVEMAWINGTTVTNNLDVGIFDITGHRIVSLGSTPQSGASAIQIADIADTALDPGNYFLAMSADATNLTVDANVNYDLGQLRANGVCETASSFPLPSSITLAGITTTFLVNLAALLGTTF